MTEQNRRCYSKKHAGKEIFIDEKFREHLLEEAKEGALICTRALLIAKELGIDPQQAGIYLDLLEVRIAECQLGLFGFTPVKRLVKKAETIDPAMRQLIEEAMENDCVPCESLLKIANSCNVSPMTLAGICEALDIHIKPCQLGAF